MRAIVLVATLAGVAVLASEMQSGLFDAITRACATAGLLMVLAALGQRLWSGAVVSDARLPGGAGLAFEESQRDVEALRREIDDLKAELKLRLTLLERELFGGAGNGGGGTIT